MDLVTSPVARRRLARGRCLALLLLAWPAAAAAQVEPAVDATEARAIPDYAPVVDETGLVDAASLDAMRRIIDATQAEVGTRVAVLVVRSVEGLSPERLAARVYRAWRLGSYRRDDGLLLLYAVEERWWQLWWGPAFPVEARDPERLAPARAVLADPADGPLGARLVQATALLARAVGASQQAVAQPYEMRRDWGRLVVPLVLLGIFAVVGLLVWGMTKGHRAWTRWMQRRMVARLEGRLLGVEVEGEWLRIRSRQSVLAAVGGLVFLLLMLNRPIVDGAASWSRGVQGFWCSHQEGRCGVELGGRTLYRLSLGEIDHFEAFANIRGEASLLAVTRGGNATLAYGWPASEVTGLAARLDGFLADPASPPLAREHDFAGLIPVAMTAGGALLLGLVLLVLWPRRLEVDRRRGLVTFRGTPRPWTRPLGAIRAVRVWSPQQEQVEAMRRRQRPMPYSRYPDVQSWVVVVDEEGRRLPATVRFGPAVILTKEPPADVRPRLEAVARRLAEHLGVPYLERVEAPSGGVVPPPA